MAGNSVISQPSVTLTLAPSARTVENSEHRTLIVGQMLTGTATAGALVEQLANGGAEDALFGANSILSETVRAFKRVNQVSRVDVLPIADNGGGTAASGAIVFSGTASAAGTYYVTIGSHYAHRLTVDVASGATATNVGASLVTAMGLDTDLYVTGVNTTGSVAITCRHKGAIGNDITLRVEGTVAGLTASITAMASGATDPSLAGLFDAIGDNRYQTIVWPHNFGLTTLKTLLDARFNVSNNILDGVGITTTTNTFANLVSAGNAENTPSVTIFGFNSMSTSKQKGSSMLELGVCVSANFAAVRALRLTEDADLVALITTDNGAKDRFGGAAIASMPYFNTPYTYLPVIPAGAGFSATEIESLIPAGVSTIGNNKLGNGVICGEVVTTYKTDAFSNPDVTYKFLPYVDTASQVREFLYNNLKTRFYQSRLTTGDVIPQRNIANEQVIRGYVKGLCKTLAGDDYVLLQAGAAAEKFIDDNMDITINVSTGVVTLNMKVPLVTQLRDIVGTVRIAFSVSN